MLNDSGDSHGSSSGVMTSLGYLKKTILREKVEPNFERLTNEDAEILHEDVKNLLGKWGVASLKTGYADASNHNSLLKK
jgi:D-alanyl-D-alanine carboxypeptidase